MSISHLVARRLSLLALVLFGVTLITFLVSHVIPGDPARMLVGQRASEETLEKIRRSMGLDQPLHVQYGRYLAGLLRLDLGVSIRTQRPVTEDLLTFFPATLELALCSIVLAVLAGIPLGVWSAVRKDTTVDHLSRTYSVLGVSTPLFWLGLMALLIFYGKLGVLPGSGRINPFLAQAPRVTGFMLIDSLLAGNLAMLGNALYHLVLPSFCLSFVHIGVFSRQVRSSMIEVLNQDYIRTARANGIPGRSLIYRHALRNALIPTVTVIGLSIGDLLAGAIMTETIFAWPGMGSYVVDSIAFLDFPAIMGFTIFVATGYVVINLLVDIAYTLLDPRIRGVG